MVCVGGTSASEFHDSRVLQSSFRKEDRERENQAWNTWNKKKTNDLLQKCCFPALPGMLRNPYLTEHTKAVKQSGHQAVHRGPCFVCDRWRAGWDLQPSFSTLTLQACCLFNKHRFCAPMHGESGEPKLCTRGMWVWGWQAKPAANPNTEQQRGCGAMAGGSLSSGVLPFKTTLAGLGRRKVITCRSQDVPCSRLVLLVTTTARYYCSVLQPAGDNTWRPARHWLGTLCFDLESALLSLFTIQSFLFSLICLCLAEILPQKPLLVWDKEGGQGLCKQGLCCLLGWVAPSWQ